ncbi:transcriptional regulator [Negadavirga shengliensis]|uniref:Transcriptional regulator n=1 Tax=Negadavirga shengliensis TaxID=1389218 RepID=A0ABV9T2I6_9BACT
MEKIRIDKDIELFCVEADAFPDGILKAHQALHQKIPFSRKRKYFGLSRPEKGKIVYWAGAEVRHTDHVEKSDGDRKLIRSGDYIGLRIKGYREDIESIGEAFNELIARPEIDPEGYCVEWYLEDDETVLCMVRLK